MGTETSFNPAFGRDGSGLYQRDGSGEEETLNHVFRKRLEVLEDFPEIDILLIVGLARCGTTPLQMVVSQLPQVKFSEFQPWKNVMRFRERKALCLKYKPDDLRGGRSLLLKETLGPSLEFECKMDPVGMLLEIGIPPERIKVIYVMRDPRYAFASWLKFLDSDPLCAITAQRALLDSYERHKSVVGKAVPFFYEMLTLGEEWVFLELCNMLGLKKNGTMLEFDETLLSRRMRWNEANEQHYWENVIAPMIARKRFRYCDNPLPTLSQEAEDLFQEEAIPQFEAWKMMTMERFGLVQEDFASRVA